MKFFVSLIFILISLLTHSQIKPLFEGDLITNDSTVNLDEILYENLESCLGEELIYFKGNYVLSNLQKIVLSDTSWTLTFVQLRMRKRTLTSFSKLDTFICDTNEPKFIKYATNFNDITECEINPSSNIIELDSCMIDLLLEAIQFKNDIYLFFASISSDGQLVNIELRIPPFDIEIED